MMLRNLLFASFALAIAGVALVPGFRRVEAAPPVEEPEAADDPSCGTAEAPLTVEVAWLAEREDPDGQRSAVSPPLRAGDEVQLTARADQDAWLYVIAFDGQSWRVIFPAAGASGFVRASWAYAVPAPHQRWRLDGGANDQLWLLAARAPVDNPVAALHVAARDTRVAVRGLLTLPLRDGSPVPVQVRALHGDGPVADSFCLR